MLLNHRFFFLALKDSKHSKHSETTQSVIIHETAIILCPVLQEVIKKDGGFDFLSWKICTSEHCEDQDTTWGWLGGMNHKGAREVKNEGIKITSNGALEIKNVQLSDAGHYMCTVKSIHHTSPSRHFVTLTVNRVGKLELIKCVAGVVAGACIKIKLRYVVRLTGLTSFC